MSTPMHAVPPSAPGSPPWVIATLYPNQGEWGEGEFLELSERTNRLIELSDGWVEVLDLPTIKHQDIAMFFYMALHAFLNAGRKGKVVAAAYPLKVSNEKFREPDLLFVLSAHLAWLGEQFAAGADGVVEILSQDRHRDTDIKRREYAEAGIPEYWIVDPRDRRVTVLRLENGVYAVAGEYAPDQHAASVVLEGFTLDVTAILAAGD